MNWLVCHIASGNVFFTGVALNVLAAALGSTGRFRRSAALCCFVGLIAIAVSATPLPYWSYAICAAISVVFLLRIRRKEAESPRNRFVVIAFAAAWITATAFELPYHFTPSLEPMESARIVIFGDSLTAGIGEAEAETWPRILARTRSMQIDDHSQMGATIGSTLKKVRSVSVPAGTIILEIGGNDVLGATPIDEFAGDLDTLLAHLSGDARHLAMFELPLPPFYNEYGRVQRRLARKYGVKLIPKWRLMHVLAGDETTLDSIHLSQEGHRRMAEMMRTILQPALTDPVGS